MRKSINIYNFDNTVTSYSKAILKRELFIGLGDLSYNLNLIIDKHTGNALGLEFNESYSKEEYKRILSSNIDEFKEKFYVEALWDDFVAAPKNNEKILSSFHIWKKGTNVNEIINWFDNNYQSGSYGLNEINPYQSLNEKNENYRYYLTQRPPSIGTHPRGAIKVESFDEKKSFEGIECWGYVEYEKELTLAQISDYELSPKNLKVEEVNEFDREIEKIQEPIIDMKIDKTVDVDEILEGLKNGVGNIFENENFIEYLNFQSKFHNYSPRNSLLINLQRPDATDVASFAKWNSLGRTVNKGETGIIILAPNVRNLKPKEIIDRLNINSNLRIDKYLLTKKDSSSYKISINGTTVKNNLTASELESFIKINKLKAQVLTGFRKAYVFDISQTSGKELPQFNLQLTDTNLEDKNGFYKNPLVKVNLSEDNVFENDKLYTFKQVYNTLLMKDLEVSKLKKEYEAKGDYYPYLKQKFEITLNNKITASPDDRYYIGDGGYPNFLEFLKGEFKKYPSIFETLENTLHSNDNSMETILAIKHQIENCICTSGIAIEYKNNLGGANGYFSPSENCICIKDDLSFSQTCKTLLHEFTHSQLHTKGYDKDIAKDSLSAREAAEIEAEATAYVVAKHFGFDTSEYSFDYISTWANGREVSELENILKVIKNTSEKIITTIKAPLELELYNTKDCIEGILKAEHIKSNDTLINSMLELNIETGKINSITDINNYEKFNTFSNNDNISSLLKNIKDNIIVEEIDVEIEMER